MHWCIEWLNCCDGVLAERPVVTDLRTQFSSDWQLEMFPVTPTSEESATTLLAMAYSFYASLWTITWTHLPTCPFSSIQEDYFPILSTGSAIIQRERKHLNAPDNFHLDTRIQKVFLTPHDVNHSSCTLYISPLLGLSYQVRG